MTSPHPPGNGKIPDVDIDYLRLVRAYVADMAGELADGDEELAAVTGQLVTGALMQAPPSLRADVYAAAKDAIAALPEDLQAAAFGLARITPDEPDTLAKLAAAVGAGEEDEGAAEEEEEKARPRLVADIPIINPALDYAGGVVWIAQQRTVRSDDDVLKAIPIIFTSERDFFLLPSVKGAHEIKLINDCVAIDKSLERAAQRWSLPAIMDFLAGKAMEICIWKLFHRLERLYYNRVWFAENGNYVIFALYTMLSYVYPVFDAIPYLHLTGLAGSGKTHAARLLATLAFNGHIEVDPTEASLFRTIEATRGLVILDDQETGVTNRKHSDNPFMTILKVGYKRGGLVTRMERRGSDFVPLTFDVYCPKVITNVFGLEDILADRTIPILMREIPAGGVGRAINTSPLRPNESQPLVDDLFLFAMTHMPAVAKLAHEPSQFGNRTEELFFPLFTLAQYIDTCAPPDDNQRSLLAELSETLEEAKNQRQVTKGQTPEQNLRLALLNLLEGRKVDEGWFSARDIEIEFYKLHSVPPDWFSDTWLGKNIGKVITLRKENRRRDPIDQEYPRLDHKTGRVARVFEGNKWVPETEMKRLTNYYIRRELL